MRVGFFHSNYGGSPLVGGLERGLVALGHTVEPYRPGVDLVLIFNQAAHTTNYVYPPMPTCGAPIAFIDTAEYGPHRARCWDAFSPGALEHDTKNREQQERLRDYLAGRTYTYFLREHLKAYDYPPNVLPIDYPLYHHSAPTRAPDREQYLARSKDVACLWGMSNQARWAPTNEIRASGLKHDVYVIEADGPRIPQREYFRRLEDARATVSFDGYGSSSFRLTEGLVRTVVLLGPLAIRMRAPLVDGETCYTYSIERLASMDPEAAFEVFARGYDHCMTHYTEVATAKYVLENA